MTSPLSVSSAPADDTTPPEATTPTDETIVVNEIFGPTFQGEGPTTGRRCAFVRLAKCDLQCAWCDTPYTWDWKGRNGVAFDPAVEARRRSIDAVVNELISLDTDRVVITGGEPLLQRRAVTELVKRLGAADRAIEIETNGRHLPLDVPVSVQYNVSPKLTSSGEPEHKRLRFEVLEALSDVGAVFKFVCGSPSELDEVAAIVDRANIADEAVWVSPLGTTEPELLAGHRRLADAVLEHRWNLTTRLHVLCWGDERGT